MDSDFFAMKMLLFDPDTVVEANDKQRVVTDIQNVLEEKLDLNFEIMSHTLEYDDWDVKSCLRAVLPPGLEFSGYAQVGHIAHLNLREEHLPYKFIIAEILLDKIAWVKYAFFIIINKLF